MVALVLVLLVLMLVLMVLVLVLVLLVRRGIAHIVISSRMVVRSPIQPGVTV